MRQYNGDLIHACPVNNFLQKNLSALKYKGSKNVFHQNQYRCRDGARDQVAAWKNQLAEKV